MIAGFKAQLYFNRARKLNSTGAYLCAIEVAYDLAQIGWEELVPPGSMRVSKEFNSIEVAFISDAKRGEGYQLQSKHILLTLLEIMNALASRGNFVAAKAKLSMYRNIIGEMAIGIRNQDSKTDRLGINENTTLLTGDDGTPKRSVGVVREIVDPDDPNFVVSYENSETRFSCQELFSATLDGLVKSAQAEKTDTCNNFAGLSASTRVIYTIVGDRPTASGYLLDYDFVRRAIKLLAVRMYNESTCGEVEFDIIYGSDMLGGGSIHLSDFFNSTEQTAFAR